MADRVAPPWPVESIPDEGLLYRRVHQKLLNAWSGVRAGAFTDYRGGMFTDWSKYSSPHETQLRASVSGFVSQELAVVALAAGDVRSPGRIVLHDPLPDNRAHANVIGEKDAEARLKFSRICRIVIATQ